MRQITTTIALAGLAIGILAPSASAWADADSSRNKGAAWLITQQRGDGSWANARGELGVQATSTALLALKNAGLSKAPTFGSAGAWLSNADADSIDSISRKVEGLAAAGLPASSQIEADRLYGMRALSVAATWGGYGGSGVDFTDTALGLTALRLGDASYSAKTPNTIFSAICNLVGARINIAAGKQAWPTTMATAFQSAGQGRPSVVTTALLLSEVRSYQQSTGYATLPCGSNTYTVATVLSEAQAWLLDQQNADNGFGEQRTDGSKGVSSVLVTAWAYRALNNQTTPPQPHTGNAQAWLLAQQDATNGSWRNDPLLTASVVAVLPAAAGAQLADNDQDGITNVVEQQISGSNQGVADARNQLDPPGLSAPGVTATSFVANATVGQPLSHDLGNGSNYSLYAGSLPPGLSMNTATGLITGIPTQAGIYSFDYQADSGDLIIGRIDVAGMPVVENSADVPLPGWALAVFASMLLGIGIKQRRKPV